MNRNVLLFGVLGAFAIGAYLAAYTEAGRKLVAQASDEIGALFVNRGLRNCNPGNIRRTATAWNNSFQTQATCEAAGRVWDADFVVFYTMADGVRAVGKILTSYARAYGINTVEGIANRYAPPNENDTASYTDKLAAAVGVGPGQIIDVYASLPQLAQGIMYLETGYADTSDNIAQEVYT